MCIGTEFILYDNGTNPDLLPSDVFDDISRQVLCKITYESNIAGRKPNAMQIYLPATVIVSIMFHCRVKRLWNVLLHRNQMQKHPMHPCDYRLLPN